MLGTGLFQFQREKRLRKSFSENIILPFLRKTRLEKTRSDSFFDYFKAAAAANDSYKISLGTLSDSETHELEEEEKIRNSTNVGVLYNIPADLLKRWGNLYKSEDSCDISEEEEEDDDTSSAYFTETTLDISADNKSYQKLSQFVTKAFSVGEDFIKDFNEKAGLENFLVKDDVIRNVKTKEVLHLEEATWCDNVKHGFYRTLDPDGKEVLSVGRYFESEKCGVFWKKLEGNSFLVGTEDANNNQVVDFLRSHFGQLTSGDQGWYHEFFTNELFLNLVKQGFPKNMFPECISPKKESIN